MSDDGKTYKRFTQTQIIDRINQLCDLLNNTDWPPNGEGVVLVQLWVATQLRDNGITIEQAIEQFKGVWNTVERMERGLPESEGGIH
jgi:hypothetical protein